jgi:uncharacterized protein YbjT (DUF2867 family)
MPFSKIAILGAYGSLGPDILAGLLETFPVSAITILTREGSNSHLTYPSGLRLISLPSYSDKDGLKDVLQGHDILISALPAAVALQLEPTIVQAAIEAGVRRFMPSEYTLDVTQFTVRAVVAGSGAPPLIKGRVDWADRLAEFAEQGRIEYTTIVTNGLMDLLLTRGMLGFDLKNQRAVLYDRGEAKTTGCTLEFVGRCVAAVVRMPEVETKKRRIRVAEVEYTGQDILGELERATGKEPTASVTDGALPRSPEPWSRFRGPNGSGMGRGTGYPVEFGAQ